MSTKLTAAVICPGRGTYTKAELGYLKRNYASANPDVTNLVRNVDDYRKSIQQPTITEIDGQEAYSASLHTAGEHASGLIYTCAMADFLSINREKIDIVAVTGNSMGWYIACAAAGALSPQAGIQVVNTMGTLGTVKPGSPYGGQVLHPIVDETWVPDTAREDKVMAVFESVRREVPELYISIRLGGYLVFGGSDAALEKLVKALPAEQGRYPLRLPNHSAFHTPMMQAVSRLGNEALGLELFQKPNLPLIDGRGHIWQPRSTDVSDLRDYTLGHQVIAPYDFTTAVEVALKEFSPDVLIVLGPGETLGGAVGQVIVKTEWLGMNSKSAFSERQGKLPFLISMGRMDQRKFAV